MTFRRVLFAFLAAAILGSMIGLAAAELTWWLYAAHGLVRPL